MVYIILIALGILALILLSGCKSNPDPHFHKWQQVDITTERWADYCKYMKKITSDKLVALEMKFYKWVSDWDLFHKLDYWDLPDEVWINKEADCDGLARLSGDMLGRFVKVHEVWWLEYYGFYRHYYYDKETDKWGYVVKAGGHAITVYKRDGELLAFSNTSWWHDQDFQDFIEIGEQTFPEGIYWVICRHWDNGEMQWQEKAKDDEILRGTNTFHRKLYKSINIKHLKKAEREVARKWLKRTRYSQS